MPCITSSGTRSEGSPASTRTIASSHSAPRRARIGVRNTSGSLLYASTTAGSRLMRLSGRRRTPMFGRDTRQRSAHGERESRHLARTRCRSGERKSIDRASGSHGEVERDETAHAVTEQHHTQRWPACARLRDHGRQVVDVVVEAHHAGPFPLAAAVSSVIGGANHDPAGDQPGGHRRVPAGVLGESVGNHHDTDRRAGGNPRPRVDAESAGADEGVPPQRVRRTRLRSPSRRDPGTAIQVATQFG